MFHYCDYPKIKHFGFKELVKTDTGLLNIPDSIYYICNLLKLAEVLDMVRDYIGVPLCVNSAFRTLEVNERVGGVPDSAHIYGLAADVTCIKSSFPTLIKCLKEFKQLNYIDELIVHEDKNFIHFSIQP